mgnify:CR=1 FL=1
MAGKKRAIKVKSGKPDVLRSSIPRGMPKVVTPEWIVKKLQKIARTQKTGLKGNKLRESMLIEMRGIIIDSLLLPKKNKQWAKLLFAKKMRILNVAESLTHATLKVNDGLMVLRDARKQLRHNTHLLLPGASPERIVALRNEFETEIMWLERAKDAERKQVVMKQAMQAQPLVMEALKFNDILIAEQLGPELKRARELENQVGGTYLNHEFPRI